MKFYFLCLILSIIYINCTKRYKFTKNFCDNKLYAEVYNINPAGVNADYLTDSLNFRILIGRTDSDHERYHYSCSGDSIPIQKFVMNLDGDMVVGETKSYSLQDLKDKHIYVEY